MPVYGKCEGQRSGSGDATGVPLAKPGMWGTVWERWPFPSRNQRQGDGLVGNFYRIKELDDIADQIQCEEGLAWSWVAAS